MTPAEIRDRLGAIGCDLSVYSNALAAIHTTLKRLAEAGELRTAPAGPGGKVSYLWVRSQCCNLDARQLPDHTRNRERPVRRRGKR